MHSHYGIGDIRISTVLDLAAVGNGRVGRLGITCYWVAVWLLVGVRGFRLTIQAGNSGKAICGW
jgi:hypothetical protein